MKRFAVALGMAALLCATMPASSRATTFTFQTVINPGDTAFTQLLGINNAGTVAGYLGDGTIVPNNGFTTAPPYNAFSPENFPGSVQTQVVGINNTLTSGVPETVGFYIDAGGVTHGFSNIGGTFATVDNPNGTSILTQLLGVNDSAEAAGYWQNAAGTQFPFTVQGGTFTGLDSHLPVNTSAQATDVNNGGWISGFFVDAGGVTHGFLLQGTSETTLDFPGATLTQALGLNNTGLVDGFYMDAAGNTHGFIYDIATGTYQEVDDPLGLNSTAINGINDKGQIVGFYVDANGNTDGFVGTPVPEPASLILIGTGLLALRRKLRKAAA